ncbi:MAG: efflux RND transporter periplasmic adaptor subunit, partial [Spirochaetaceae bacterium]|nr:efflux RND transporter periplasmic adaptor subunit [Spirochaetaceae bacterium]
MSKKKGRKGFIVIIVVLIVILAIVVGLGVMKKLGADVPGAKFGPGKSKSTEESEEIIFAVNTTLAVVGPIADYFEINGEVVTSSSVDTYAETQGILARIHTGLGDYVREGQVIAEIDPSRPGLNYALSPVKARVSGTITALPLNQG